MNDDLLTETTGPLELYEPRGRPVDLRASVTRLKESGLKLCLYAAEGVLRERLPGGVVAEGELARGTLVLRPAAHMLRRHDSAMAASTASDGPRAKASLVYDYLTLSLERLGFTPSEPLYPLDVVAYEVPSGALVLDAVPEPHFVPRSLTTNARLAELLGRRRRGWSDETLVRALPAADRALLSRHRVLGSVRLPAHLVPLADYTGPIPLGEITDR